MGTIRFRFIGVALVVGLFAVGMAAFLNYFKYKSTISGIAKTRAVLVGRGIENTVQASLAIGMQFAELDTLTALIQRERTSDRLVRGIDVIDTAGIILYSTENPRVGQRVPDDWLTAAEHAKGTEWGVESPEGHMAGISVKNAFNLTVGYIAMRYASDDVERAAASAGRGILIAAIGAFAGLAIVAPLLLILVIRRFERDLATLEAAAGHIDDSEEAPAGSAFESAISDLRRSLADAHRALDGVKARIEASGSG
jgi:hypothetical protein